MMTSQNNPFENIQQAKIKANNLLPLFIFSIFSITFGIIWISFLIIYLLKEPMTINDVLYDYSDHYYQYFMKHFIFIFAAILFLFILSVAFFGVRSAKKTIYLSTDFEGNRFVYLESNRECVYMDSSRYIEYQVKKNRILVEKDPTTVIQKNTSKCFLLFNQEQPYKVKESAKKKKFYFVTNPKWRSYIKVLTVYYDDFHHVSSVIESEMTKSSSSRQITRINRYVVESTTMRPSIHIHPEIQRNL